MKFTEWRAIEIVSRILRSQFVGGILNGQSSSAKVALGPPCGNIPLTYGPL